MVTENIYLLSLSLEVNNIQLQYGLSHLLKGLNLFQSNNLQIWQSSVCFTPSEVSKRVQPSEKELLNVPINWAVTWKNIWIKIICTLNSWEQRKFFELWVMWLEPSTDCLQPNLTRIVWLQQKSKIMIIYLLDQCIKSINSFCFEKDSMMFSVWHQVNV